MNTNMSTAFNISTTPLQQVIVPPPAAVKTIDTAPLLTGKSLPDRSEDEIEAHMRRKLSPKDYYDISGGGFAEGTYTEF